MAAGDYQSVLKDITALADFVNQNVNKGKLRVIKTSYTLLASEAATEVLDISELLPGDIIDEEQSWIYLPNPGTALTVDIGDDDDSTTADPDRYSDGLDVKAGGYFKLSAGGTVAAQAATPYAIAQKALLHMTFKTVTSITAVKINFNIVVVNNT